MHVEDQVDGVTFLKNADQQESCQKGFTGTTLAKDAITTSNQRGNVKRKPSLHIQWSHDIEMFFILIAENNFDIVFSID